MLEDIELSDNLDKFLDPVLAALETTSFDISNHIDYKLATTNYQVSGKLLKLEKAAYLPRLSGFYSYTKTSYGNDANLFKSGVSWFPSSMIGLNLET